MKIRASDIFWVVLSGATTALAFPKFNLAFFSWISLIPLFFVLSKKTPGKGFLTGWIAGTFFYAVLLYWIPAVPAHYGGLSIPTSILIYVGFVCFLGLTWAAFSLCFTKIHNSFPVLSFFLVPFLWVSFEHIITHILTGFPWGLLGYGQYKNLYFIQMASITGITGLSFVLVLFQSFFVLSMKLGKKAPFFAALALVILIHVSGFVNIRDIQPGKDSFSAAVIQGNVSSDIQWGNLTFEEVESLFNQHLRLSREASLKNNDLIIWPEFSVPLCFGCPYGIYQEFKNRLYQFVQESSCTLLLGTNEKAEKEGGTEYYNTSLLLKPDLSQSQYHKIHLVPFGEYTPYKKIFGFISRVTHAIGDITPGDKFVLHDYKGNKFGTPICYEIIFPDLVRKFTKNGAHFLVTITNDGWYGKSSAPYQHFSMAVLRAVENRRFLLRAATTGISGIVDPYGRILSRSELMTQTMLYNNITPLQKQTMYTKLGDVLPLISLTLAFIFLILAVIKRPNERP
ncbi:MAG: apolipoprotein N-acyltransferase [Candidatus Aminicenantes bacterium]